MKMNELTLQWIDVIKLLSMVGFASLYAFGGMRGKWKRRILGPVLLTLTIVGISLWKGSFSLWYILYMPLLFGALSVGYGASNTKTKILKRLRYSTLILIAALPLVIITGKWVLFALYAATHLAFSIVMGVINPEQARTEETLIGLTIGLSVFLI